MDYPVTRTPEQGHTAPCLAKAMVAAIENARDQMGPGVYLFRIWAQDNTALQWADEYLATGTTQCICPPTADEVSDAIDQLSRVWDMDR